MTRLKCKVNLFHRHNWTHTTGLGAENLCLFPITFGPSESVISPDNNTSCVFMRETACSSMHNTFTPDSDSVYLAKGAVSLHDNVVTDGINARATHDIHSGRGTWKEGPQTMWRWSHDSGKESWRFFLAQNCRLSWWLPSDQCKMNGWLHFPLSWALKALCKTFHAEPSRTADCWGCHARCRAAHQDSDTVRPIQGNPSISLCSATHILTHTPMERPLGVNKPAFFRFRACSIS